MPELEPFAGAWGEDTTEDHWSTKPLEIESLVCGAGGTTSHSHPVRDSLTEKPKSNHYPTKKRRFYQAISCKKNTVPFCPAHRQQRDKPGERWVGRRHTVAISTCPEADNPACAGDCMFQVLKVSETGWTLWGLKKILTFSPTS